MSSRLSTAAPILAVLAAALLLPLALYVGSYLCLGDSEDYAPFPGARLVRLRVYDSQRWAQFFEPAAHVEAWLNGQETGTGYTEPY